MRDGIKEILESGQFPGTSIREPVRRMHIRDAGGKEVRVLYAGGEDTGSVERDIVKHAEVDEVDLATAEVVNFETERGQGIGRGNRRGKYDYKRRPPKTYPMAMPIPKER